MGCTNAAQFERVGEPGSSGPISRQQLKSIIEKQPELWAMAQVNTGASAAEAQDAVLRVVLRRYDLDSDGVLSRKELYAFKRDASLKNARSNLDFFHEVLFAIFDTTQTGQLDEGEFDAFLDVFYEQGSIFAGDGRLPPKEELKMRAYKELDQDGDGMLTVDDLKPLMLGRWCGSPTGSCTPTTCPSESDLSLWTCEWKSETSF